MLKNGYQSDLASEKALKIPFVYLKKTVTDIANSCLKSAEAPPPPPLFQIFHGPNIARFCTNKYLTLSLKSKSIF